MLYTIYVIIFGVVRRKSLESLSNLANQKISTYVAWKLTYPKRV